MNQLCKQMWRWVSFSYKSKRIYFSILCPCILPAWFYSVLFVINHIRYALFVKLYEIWEFFCHIECINIVNLYLLWATQITLFFIVLAGAWERGDMHFNLHVCTGKCRERIGCFSFRIRPHQFCFGKEKRKPRIEKDLLGFRVQSSASAVSQIPNLFHNRLCYSKISSFLLVICPVLPISYFIWSFAPEFHSFDRKNLSNFRSHFMHACSCSRNVP